MLIESGFRTSPGVSRHLVAAVVGAVRGAGRLRDRGPRAMASVRTDTGTAAVMADEGGGVLAAFLVGGRWSAWVDLELPGRARDVSVASPEGDVVDYYAVADDGVLWSRRRERGALGPWRADRGGSPRH